jgi:hypothetical protein
MKPIIEPICRSQENPAYLYLCTIAVIIKIVDRRVIFYFFSLIGTVLFAQRADTSMFFFRQAERELADIQQRAFHSKSETERIEGNKEFIAVWDKIVADPRILRYDFKMLRDVSILESADGQLKLVSWNLHRNDGTHGYFGYLLVNSKKVLKKGFLKKETVQTYEHHKLIDRSAAVKSPENHIGSPDKWFGMLYTQMIACEGYYTLIGWDGNDKLTQRKFVDVLYFKSNGQPVFGKDVFKFPRKNPKRLMFEYSSEVTMSLKYDKDRHMIVYSHLGARQEGNLLEGQYQFYGPDGSYDALVQKKDKWITVEDIDARNARSVNDHAKKPDPKKQKPVYKPK